MSKKTKNNTITVRQSKNLGTDLTNIMSGLQALRHHANTLMIAKHAGADKIGLPFDSTSLTWSQLQGLPVTTGDPADYDKIVNRGRDYPVANTVTASQKPHYRTPRQSGNKTITMRVIDTLLHGFGDEGGRNVAVTRFVGLLLSKWVDADVATAYELTTIANGVTDNPLPEQELERTFESIVKSEIRKRGVNGN